MSAFDRWLPRGGTDDKEARLEKDGEHLLPGSLDWSELWRWWLVHNGRANTPNWDLAASCSIQGRRGIVLVESKAHIEELSNEPKREAKAPSQRSLQNSQRIRQAIAEASRHLSVLVPGVSISSNSHYQLANRVAFTWKLASMGLAEIRGHGNQGTWKSGDMEIRGQEIRGHNTYFWLIDDNNWYYVPGITSE